MIRTTILSVCLSCILLSFPAIAQEPAPERWVNPVLKQLREGKPVIGGTVSVASVEIAAQMANMGFDFLWVEMEHSPISWETYREMVLATRGLTLFGCFEVIRVTLAAPVNELLTLPSFNVVEITRYQRFARAWVWRQPTRTGSLVIDADLCNISEAAVGVRCSVASAHRLENLNAHLRDCRAYTLEVATALADAELAEFILVARQAR